MRDAQRQSRHPRRPRIHRLGRVDRTLDGQTQYVTSAGARRGKRYGLNFPGLAQAEKILSEILK